MNQFSRYMSALVLLACMAPAAQAQDYAPVDPPLWQPLYHDRPETGGTSLWVRCGFAGSEPPTPPAPAMPWAPTPHQPTFDDLRSVCRGEFSRRTRDGSVAPNFADELIEMLSEGWSETGVPGRREWSPAPQHWHGPAVGIGFVF